MWAITNHTPFKAAKTWGRDQDGVHQWIVGVKGIFDIKADGTLELASEQVEPLRVPEYNGEVGTSSLRYDAELVGPKPTTDVVLNATAYAPSGRPSTEFMIGMRIGPIRKRLKVKGNQTWDAGSFGSGRSAVEPVAQVPIIYERAYGGYDHSHPDPRMHRMDARNPVGCGVVAKASPQARRPLPNFEYPDGEVEETGPAGFGAIDSFWSPRRELNGTYDEAWQTSRCPLLPADWDPRATLCSPLDQRCESYLRGGELVELENLTPEGTLHFALPRVLLSFRTYIDNRVEDHQGWLTTVVIEPDHPRVIMVWQSWLTVRTDGDYLDQTVVREKTRIR